MITHKNCKLAFGCTRVVILVSKWAIKIPSFYSWRLFLLGLLANMQEAQFSKTGWPELCPVKFSIWGGWLVVMRRAEVLSEFQFFALKLQIKMMVTRPDYCVPCEMKHDSFGILDNNLVVVDYGN
jgi:hypothetical protein